MILKNIFGITSKKDIVDELKDIKSAITGEDIAEEVGASQFSTAWSNASTTFNKTMKAMSDYGMTGFEALKTSSGAFFKVLWSGLSVFSKVAIGLGAVAAVGTILYKVYDALTVSYEEAKENLEKTESELESVESEVKSISSQIDELNSKDTLSLTDKEDLERLKEENEELRIRQKYLEMQKQEEEKEVSDKAKDEYNVKFGRTSREDIDKYKNDLINSEGNSYTSSYLTGESSDSVNSSVGYAAHSQSEEEINDLAELIASYEYYSEKKKEAIQNEDVEAIEKYNEKLKSISTSLQEDRIELQGFKDDVSKTGDSEELNSINQQIKLIDDTLLSANENLVNFINSDEISSEKSALLELVDSGKSVEDGFAENFPKINEYLEENGLTIKDLISILGLYQDKLEDTAQTATNVARSLSSINEDKSNLDSIFETYENNNGKLSQEEVSSILEQNPEYIYYLTKVGEQYKLNEQALNDWNAVNDEQKDYIDNMIGENSYLKNYDNLLDNIMKDSSHIKDSGTKNVIVEENLDALIQKNKDLNQSFLDGKISATEYFNTLSDSITNSGLENALKSINGEFDNTTDYIEETVSVLATEISDAMLQSNKRFLKGETSVEEYMDELKAGSQAQQKLLKSTYALTTDTDGYAKAIKDVNAETKEAISSYNDLVDAQKQLEKTDGIVDVLSDNAEFINQYTDSAGNLMDTILDDSRLTTYISSLSNELYNFAVGNEENMNAIAQVLVDTAGYSTEQASAIVAQGGAAIANAVGNSMTATQALTNLAMGNISGAITNTSSAIGSVLTSLGKAIDSFEYNIKATPYIKGKPEFSVDKNGINLSLPTFGFDISGSGGTSVKNFASSLSSAGNYFSNVGASQAAAKALDIDSYLPSGKGSGSTSSGYRPSNNKSGNGGGGSGSGSETEETLDWIETKISSLEREIENLGQTADASYKLWADRNSALADEMSKVTDEIKVQQQAYDYYMNKANSVGLSSTYQDLVKNGAIKIETLKDEKLIDKINSYKEWYEKALDCKDAIQDLNDELANLARQKFDNISSEFENLMSVVEHELNMLDAYVSQTEERGRFVSTKYYSSMIALEKQNIALLESEYAKLNASLNEAVNSGQIQKYSEEWYNMAGEINSVSEELVEANTSIIEFQNSIRDLEWEVFDKLQEFISQIQGESEFLQELMSDEKMFSDEGSITEYGRATLGLHAVNYETYMRQASDYAEELKKINKEIAEDPNNLTLLERRQELLEAQRDMISSAEDEKQAMKDLISEGYDTFLNYMQELIDKRKEAMQSIKDLYDYEKNVSEQTDEIARLQKIIDSYGGDNSEETKAKLQEYTVQLQDAKEALEETEYEKYLSDKEQLLDEMYSTTEEWINTRLDNLDGLVQGVIDSTNENAESIKDTLVSETEKVGMTLTDEMNSIWSTDGSAGKIVAMYGDGFNSHLTTISSTLSGIKDYIYSMVKESDKEATSSIDKVQNGNVTNLPTSSENNTKPNTNNTTTTKPTTSTSSTNSNSKWGSWFIKKKNYVSKSKLKKDSSIVDFNESTLNTLNCGETLRA